MGDEERGIRNVEEVCEPGSQGRTDGIRNWEGGTGDMRMDREEEEEPRNPIICSLNKTRQNH